MCFYVAGCPQNCNGNGRCQSEEGEYKCECSMGWAGSDCSIQLETNCSDEIDNDHGRCNHYNKIDEGCCRKCTVHVECGCS